MVQLGRSQIRARLVGRPMGFLGMLCLVNSRHLLAMLERSSTGGHIGNPESRVFSCGYGKASEHAVISSFPVSAVGGTSEPAVYSFSAEVTAPSPCPLRNVTSTLGSSGESHGTGTVTRTLQRMSSAHLAPAVVAERMFVRDREMWRSEDEEHADAWWNTNDWQTASSSGWWATGGSGTEGCWSKSCRSMTKSGPIH